MYTTFKTEVHSGFVAHKHLHSTHIQWITNTQTLKMLCKQLDLPENCVWSNADAINKQKNKLYFRNYLYSKSWIEMFASLPFIEYREYNYSTLVLHKNPWIIYRGVSFGDTIDIGNLKIQMEMSVKIFKRLPFSATAIRQFVLETKHSMRYCILFRERKKNIFQIS